MGISPTKIGFFPGAFDLIHPGHIKAFAEAKNHCDYLIVGLQIDPSVDRPQKNKPIMSLEERYIILSAIRFVDEIIFYRTEKELHEIDLNKDKKFNVRFMGADHQEKEHHPINAEIVYVSRNHCWSSTELRNRVKNA